MSKMMEITTRYANGEEEDRIWSGKHKTVGEADGGNTRKQKPKVPPTPQAEAAAVTSAKFKGKGKAQFTPKKKPFNNPILDQPCPIHTKIDEEGRQALVVDPVVEGVRLRNVLMDGGNELNIMYADTLKGMGIPMSRLSESNMQFHGVVLGQKAKSLGQIAFEVIFGSDKNFRKEKLTFEVVDFQSAYHAILGRPAYVSFMARPCYVYLKLKMPGPKGVITITGNRQRAEECLQEGSRIADQQMAVLELEEYKKTVDPADLMRSKKPASESAFQSAGETKKVSIHPTDESVAPTNISITLDPK
ncbi:hypothetical protein ZWY2020_037390 [Hordeum vulgare]|nr:hypothetical protein ZWY2020_037390 [Hordeum vulgare]